MGKHLLEEDPLTSTLHERTKVFARVRTLTILRQIDGTRKGIVLQFLYDSGVIDLERVVDLRHADLKGVMLSGASLIGADLSEVNLRGADLRETDLSHTNLYGVDLSYADLRTTGLRGADMRDADLRRANLADARLTREQLSHVKSLESATITRFPTERRAP